MKISVVDKEENFYSLRNKWDELLSKSNSNTIFLTWEWMYSWWKNYKDDKQLFILKAEDSVDGELIGIAPFYLKTLPFFKFLSLNCIFFIGDGTKDSDYLDLIVSLGRKKEVIENFLDFLEKNNDKWDLIFLNEIPESTINLEVLTQIIKRSGYLFSQKEGVCAYTVLPENWDSYLTSLNPRMRTKIKSNIRKLEENFQTQFIICTNQSELTESLSSLFELHQKRWKQRYYEGAFLSPLRCQFYHDISQYFLEKDWLRLYSLKVDGQYVAHQFCFEYNGNIFLLQEGFDTDWNKWEVGNVLRAYVFKDIITKGIKEYDFLGGVSFHKTSWGAITKKTLYIIVGKPFFKNKLYIQLPILKERLKEKLKKVIPESLLELRSDLIEKLRRRKIKKKIESDNQNSIISLSRIFIHFLYRILAYIIVYSGILKLINRFQLYKNKKGKIPYLSLKRRLSNSFRIFIYHRVNNYNDIFFDTFPSNIFEKQMRYLSKNFCVMKIEDILEILKKEKYIPDNLIAITFDDGYEDNYLYAYPILRKYSIPTTIFCTTGFISTKKILWFDKIRMAFKNTNESYLNLKNGPGYPLTTLREKLYALYSVMEMVTYLEEEKKISFINWLFNTLKVEESKDLSVNMLTWEQIKEMKNNGISFGAHTVSHPILTILPHHRIIEEVFESKKIIEEHIGTRVECFAYPNGKEKDFNNDIKNILQKVGYSCAVTTISGMNNITQSPFELKREQLWERSIPLFMSKLTLKK